METISYDIYMRWGIGALLGFVLVMAFLKAFFSVLNDNRRIHHEVLKHQADQEERFFLGMMDCINKNTSALEQMEASLQELRIQLVSISGESRQG